mmetsp:Transcript_28184/g.43182  ORF Transcript_28184/g.43182 Transcript_28184/m.43182 type:complete len:97 (+) Transcript_28184:67-357(+)
MVSSFKFGSFQASEASKAKVQPRCNQQPTVDSHSIFTHTNQLSMVAKIINIYRQNTKENNSTPLQVALPFRSSASLYPNGSVERGSRIIHCKAIHH